MTPPKTWACKELGSLARIQNGFAFDSDRFDSRTGTPLIRIRDLKAGTTTECRFNGPFDEAYLVRAGDVLIGMDGEFRAYKWNGPNALLNQRVCRLQDFSTDVEPDFVFFQLNKHLEEIEDNTPFATVKHLSSRTIAQIALSFPARREQRRLVARIKECLTRVEEMQRLREEAEAEAGLLFDCYIQDRYASLCQQFGTRPLHELAKPCGGGTPDRKRADFWNGSLPWVSPKDMKRWEIDSAQETISPTALDNSAAKLIQPPVVLFVVRGMILIHTLPVAVSKVPLAINQDMKALVPTGPASAEFLAFMLRGASRLLLEQVEIAGHGTRRLQTEKWINLPIPQAGKLEASLIAQFRAARQRATELISHLANGDLTLLRESILREAFAGRL